MLAAPRKRSGVDAATLQAAYFRRYVDAWKAFLLSLSVKEPANIDEVRGLLKTFVTRPAARRHLAQRQQEPDLQGRVAAAGALPAKAKGSAVATAGRRQEEAHRHERRRRSAAAGGKRAGAKASDEDPTSPEDVGREFAAFLNFGLTKPTGLETYGQILGRAAAAPSASRARPIRAPSRPCSRPSA